MAKKSDDPIKAALGECRALFWGALSFSLVISLLNLAVPIYSMQVFDRVLSSGSQNTLIMLTVVVVGALLFLGLLTLLRSVVFTQISRWLDDKLSTEVVHQSISLSLMRPNVGAQPMRDLNAIRSFIGSPTLGQIFDAPWAIIFFVALYLINLTLGIIVTIAAMLLLGLAFLAQRWPSNLLAESGDAQLKAMQSLETITRNAEVVKAMGMGDAATHYWRSQNDRALEAAYHASNIGTGLSNFTKTMRMGVQVLVTGLGAWFVINGTMSMGAIIAVNILTGKALAPFDAAVPIYQGWTSVKKAHGRLLAVFGVSDASVERLELPEPTGALAVQSAALQDPISKRLLLNNISLDVPAGEALGIIGPSGSGKTTLSRLLVGVRDPSRGKVCLDGASLHHWKPDQLAQAIGYLPQDVELFSGTVAENIARMRSDVEDADIVNAAQMAEVHDFIQALPDGYQTDIGENGRLLSAGQRQRIGLARCFFGSPKLIVLDEPNSNLDTEGEKALAISLTNAKQAGITVVVIAHRPSLLHHVDQVAVMKNGEIALQGPASEVLEKLASPHRSIKPVKLERAG